MTTRHLQASVPAHSSPHICSQSGVRLNEPSVTQQLMGYSAPASLISLQNSKELCSLALLNVQKQITWAWRHSSYFLSQAGTNARAYSLRAWKRIRAQQIAHSHSKRLQVAETVSLGEKRFVAVIKVDGREFLIGGGAANVSLLAQLNPGIQLDVKKSFDGILTKKMTVPKKQPAKRAKRKVAKPLVEKSGGRL